eukprot:9499612-Pyramimonas_sp.AAC.1
MSPPSEVSGGKHVRVHGLAGLAPGPWAATPRTRGGFSARARGAHLCDRVSVGSRGNAKHCEEVQINAKQCNAK